MSLRRAKVVLALPGRRTTVSLYLNGNAYSVSLPDFRNRHSERIPFRGVVLPEGGISFFSKSHPATFLIARGAKTGRYRDGYAGVDYLMGVQFLSRFEAYEPPRGLYFRAILKDGGGSVVLAPNRAAAVAWAQEKFGDNLFTVEGASIHDIEFHQRFNGPVHRSSE